MPVAKVKSAAQTRRWRILRIALGGLALGAACVAVPFVQRVRMLMTLSNDGAYAVRDGFYHCVVPGNADPATRAARVDEAGVAFADFGPAIGRQDAPVAVASFVLSLVPWADDPDACRSIVVNLDHLIACADVTPRGNLVFRYRFDWPLASQKNPWCSAMAQGMAASAFLWGHRITGDDRYLNAARQSVLAMREDEYGFTTPLENGCWPNEFPGYGANILDGALGAIAGVYDLHRSLDDSDPDREAVTRLLNDLVVGLKSNWRAFDSASGHWFDDQFTLISPGYHGANLGWLTYLGGYDAELLDIRREYAADHRLAPCVEDTARFAVHRVARALGLRGMTPRIR